MSKAFQPLFIIGSPRSGTTMLQILLGEHPQVSTTVELTLFKRYISPWLRMWDEEKGNSLQGRWNQGLPFVLEREEVVDFLKTFLATVYSKLQDRKQTATHVLDKHPANALFTPLIRDLLPHARFIHVIRDGRDVACSMVSAARQIGFGTHTIPESAVAWKRHVLAAREASRQEGYFEIRYEAFLRDGVAAYRDVLDFCGLPYNDEWIAQTIENNTFEKMKAARRSGDVLVQARRAHYRSGRAGAWKETLSELDAFEFDRLAGDLLRELGYENSADWWHRSSFSPIVTPPLATARRRYASLLPVITGTKAFRRLISQWNGALIQGPANLSGSRPENEGSA